MKFCIGNLIGNIGNSGNSGNIGNRISLFFCVDASEFTDLAIAIGNEDELQFHGFLSRSLEKDREGSKELQRLILTLQQSFCLSFISQTNEFRENWRLLSFPQRFYGFGQ